MLEEGEVYPSCKNLSLYNREEESGDEELAVLPRHTKVMVTGNNRTKSVLVGLQGVVKKAVGLGGWHWLVLKNGIEVKLQRNALSVLEPPTGNEEDKFDFGNSSSSSDINDKDNGFSCGFEFSKIRKPKVRCTKPLVSSTSAKPSLHSSSKGVQVSDKASQLKVNIGTLSTSSLWRYWRHFKLGHANPNMSREQLINTIQQHFNSRRVSENQVITNFVQAAKRLKSDEGE